MISRDNLDRSLSTELSLITGPALERFNRHRFEPQKHRCVRSEEIGEELIYALAKRERSIIVFDDVEEEFGVGTSDPDGVLRTWSLYDSLLTCIKCFPDEKYAPLENT